MKSTADGIHKAGCGCGRDFCDSRPLRRRELKVEDISASVWVITYQNFPVYYVHGVFSTERKALAELKRLAKDPDNQLSAGEKKYNRISKNAFYVDPMDAFCIKEAALK